MLIVGYGSTIRGDDAAGPAAARRLAALGFDSIDVQQLTPELAERVAAARTVFFLDAHAGLEPGAVSLIPLTEGATGPLEHHATPAGLLRLARTTFGAAPEAWLVAIGGERFEFSEQLSSRARRGVEVAVEQVLEMVNGNSGDDGAGTRNLRRDS